MSIGVHPKKSWKACKLVNFILNVSLSNKRYHFSQQALFLKPGELNGNLGEDEKRINIILHEYVEKKKNAMKEKYFLGNENFCNNGERYYFKTHMLQTQVEYSQ